MVVYFIYYLGFSLFLPLVGGWEEYALNGIDQSKSDLAVRNPNERDDTETAPVVMGNALNKLTDYWFARIQFELYELREITELLANMSYYVSTDKITWKEDIGILDENLKYFSNKMEKIDIIMKEILEKPISQFHLYMINQQFKRNNYQFHYYLSTIEYALARLTLRLRFDQSFTAKSKELKKMIGGKVEKLLAINNGVAFVFLDLYEFQL